MKLLFRDLSLDLRYEEHDLLRARPRIRLSRASSSNEILDIHFELEQLMPLIDECPVESRLPQDLLDILCIV